MRLKYLTIILAALTLCFSCARRVETGYDAIDYVDKLMSESYSSLQKMAAQVGNADGTIVLVGDPMRCVAVSETMMVFDEFDNVDARPVKDSLPDFAGETIVSLMDFANPPYDSLHLTPADSLFFREVAVRSALAAMDSSVNCKILVICSPQLALKGTEDILDLFGKIGCDVPVISSIDSTFSLPEACFKVMREKNMFTHDIAHPVARLMMNVGGDMSAFPTVKTFDESLVPEYFADTVGVFAPYTYVSHVQNKDISGRNR